MLPAPGRHAAADRPAAARTCTSRPPSRRDVETRRARRAARKRRAKAQDQGGSDARRLSRGGEGTGRTSRRDRGRSLRKRRWRSLRLPLPPDAAGPRSIRGRRWSGARRCSWASTRRRRQAELAWQSAVRDYTFLVTMPKSIEPISIRSKRFYRLQLGTPSRQSCQAAVQQFEDDRPRLHGASSSRACSGRGPRSMVEGSTRLALHRLRGPLPSKLGRISQSPPIFAASL